MTTSLAHRRRIRDHDPDAGDHPVTTAAADATATGGQRLALAIASLCWVATASLLVVLPRQPLDRAALVQTVALFGSGALIVLRTDRQRIGWLLIVPGVVFPFLYADGGNPLVSWLFPLTNLGFLAIALLLLVFPTGRLSTRTARIAALLFTIVIGVVIALDLARVAGLTDVSFDVTSGLGFVGFMAVAVVGLALQIGQYRRRPRLEQLQLKWFLVAIAGQFAYPVMVALGVDNTTVAFAVVDNVVTSLWPVAILLAITRYRLYEIDRIVSRTVAYAVVLGSLAAVFVGGVALVTTVVPAQGRFAVAITTVVVVALFNPWRRRVVDAVDRRFNRQRFEAQQVIERFGRSVQDETDFDAVRARLEEVLSGTLAPTTVALWQPSSADR
jgi:hypothetical protein